MTLDELKNLSKDEAIQAVSKWSGISESDLRGIHRVESSSGKDPAAFQPNKDPKSTAFGDFQITNTTAAGIEKQTGVKLDRNNFYDSLWGAGYVLKQNMAAFNGDSTMALGAYKEGTAPSAATSPAARKYVAQVRGVPEDEYAATAERNADILRQLNGAYQLTGDRLMNMRAADIRKEAITAGKEDKVPGFQQRAADLGAAAVALNALDKGETAPLNAMADVEHRIKALPAEAVSKEMTKPQADPSLDPTGLIASTTADMQQTEAQVTAAGKVGFFDQARAAFDNTAVIKQLSRLAVNDELTRQNYDPDYRFDAARLDEFRKDPMNFTHEELLHLSEASSRQDELRIVAEIGQRRENDRTIAARGGSVALLAGLTGGLADPVGWAAGIGAGKVAQLAYAGRASMLARAGIAAAENAAANIAITAMLDAAGGYVTKHDYLMAGVTGATLGAGFGVMGKAIEDSIHGVARGAAKYNNDLQVEALKRVGPDATPEQFQSAMRDIEHERAAARVQSDSVILAPVDETQRLSGLQGLAEGETPRILTEDENLRADVKARHGLDSITDEAERAAATEMYARAEDSLKRRPVDVKKAESMLTKLGGVGSWLESTGMVMARSKNPIMQWAASNLSEIAGSALERGRTASILKSQLEDHGRFQWGEYNSAFDTYRKARGVGIWDEFTTGQARKEFDKAVALEVNARRFGRTSTDDLHIKAGADAWEAGMDRFRTWQQTARTVGHEALGASSRGYMPLRLDPHKIIEWQNAGKLGALENHFAQQFVDQLGIPQDQAVKVAKDYIGYAKRRALGGTDVPGNLHNPDMADALEEALAKAGVYGQETMQKFAERLQRGGAGFTKTRKLDIDISGQVLDPKSGEMVPLIDFYSTDMAKLYQGYMARVTGEVALAQHGIYGTPGIKTMREAMTHGPNAASPKEMEAFDAFINDMLGRGEGPSGAERVWSNVRALSSMRYLGGMAITQTAEMIQLASHLGVGSLLKSVPLLRQAFDEVRAGGGSKLVSQIEVYGGYLDAEARFHFPFEEPNQVRLYGHDSPGIATKMIRSAGRGFQKISGHQAVHRFQMKMAVEQIGVKALRAARNGDVPHALLADMGFTAEKLAAIREDLPNIATFDDAGNLRDLDFSKTKNPAAVADFIQATQRGARQIIQGHYRGETGKYATSALGRFLTQFRSFSILSAEKQWARQVGAVGYATAGLYLIGQLAIAAPIHLARVQLAAAGKSSTERRKYLENELNPVAFSRSLMNYASLTGVLDIPTDAVMGVANAFGAPTGDNARLGTRGIEGLNPTLGYLGQTYKAGSRLLYNPSGDNLMKLGRAALPGGNLPYLLPMLNHMAE